MSLLRIKRKNNERQVKYSITLLRLYLLVLQFLAVILPNRRLVDISRLYRRNFITDFLSAVLITLTECGEVLLFKQKDGSQSRLSSFYFLLYIIPIFRLLSKFQLINKTIFVPPINYPIFHHPSQTT